MAAKFNSSSFSRSANLPSIGTSSFTVCGFAKYNGNTGTYGMIFDLDDGSSWLQLGMGSSGNTLQLFSAFSGESSALATLSVGDIFFWAVSCQPGANGITAYYKPLNSNTFSSVNGTASNYTPTILYIGNDPWSELFNGSVWNVKFWDRVLTAAELQIESSHRLVQFTSGLNFHWPMSTGSDVYDISGNGRNATVNGVVNTEDIGVKLWNQRQISFIPTVVSSPVTFSSDLVSQSTLSPGLVNSPRLASILSAENSLSGSVATGIRLQVPAASSTALTASIATGIVLSTVYQGASLLTPQIVAGIRLSSTFNAVNSLSASLQVGVKLGSVLSSNTAVSPGLLTNIQVAALNSVESSLTGNLTTGIKLSQSIPASSSLSGNLFVTTPVSLACNLAVSNSATLSLSNNIRLSSQISSVHNCSFDLMTGLNLSSSIGLQSNLTGDIDTPLQGILSCNFANVANFNSSLSNSILFSEDVSATQSLNGSLLTEIPIECVTISSASFSGELLTGIPLSVSLSSSQSLTSTLEEYLRSSFVCVSKLNAALFGSTTIGVRVIVQPDINSIVVDKSPDSYKIWPDNNRIYILHEGAEYA